MPDLVGASGRQRSIGEIPSKVGSKVVISKIFDKGQVVLLGFRPLHYEMGGGTHWLLCRCSTIDKGHFT
jgi:hypothetical protein